MSASSATAVSVEQRMIVPSHGHGQLRPFQKGQSGNPDGCSPERRKLNDAIEKLEMPRVHALLCSLYDRAMEGDLFAAKMWLDQVRGPVKPRKEDEIGDAVEAKLMELISVAKAQRVAP